ncbi:pyrroloquinoline quinone biosynthesis protein PqqF [Pluralibacter gergoviae]|uniref:pyrroloquinoline quinone biosynthesis protein PqqF n=1 Tax=Pluralibacter gergoviae TaxID=61647 RepID=UPI000A645D98|nr:pyrroloquinoline quinone biosynthesis protein PqqF [Pluralibacter gergoviae]
MIDVDRLTLANGLRCHLIHQPQAREAAALLKVDAGSLQEPDRWPGLAHLLEHLLFADSADFRGEERLMPWAQRRGGQVNASTRLGESAFFFQAGADDLPVGLARLVDMLVAPLLLPEAITQEIAVIDAEYRLLQTHADMLCEAALFDLLPDPPSLGRFRVGSGRTFGDNVTETAAALRAFHRRYYGAANAALWLQGPQPLAELARLAETYGSLLPAGEARPGGVVAPARQARSRLLRLAGDARFWLTFRLSGGWESLSAAVAQLSRFWNDDAPGGLLAQLREEGLCDSLDVKLPWREAQGGWLAIVFRAAALDDARAARIERLFYQHLAAVMDTGAAQREHYRRLAQAEFGQLSPLEQLRARALGAAPGEGADLSGLILQIRRAGPLRLLTGPALREVQIKETQGFRLAVADWRQAPSADAAPVAFSFYPRRGAAAPPPSDGAPFPLLGFTSGEPSPTLLLRPAFFQPLPDGEAQVLHRRLRPLLALLRHAGGRGEWRQQQGVWQLALNLPDDSSSAIGTVAQIAQALAGPVEPAPPGSGESIALRRLIAALPQQLMAGRENRRWLAAWDGADDAQRQALAVALGALAPPEGAQAPALGAGVSGIACPGEDDALVIFIPLPDADDSALAALRALGHLYAPRFFQRLRVEQRLGYAVSARALRVADVDGILLAVQSPDTGWRTLLRRGKDFLREVTFTADALEEARRALRAEAVFPAEEALRRRWGLPEVSEAAIAGITLAQVEALHRRLCRRRRRWRVLITAKEAE